MSEEQAEYTIELNPDPLKDIEDKLRGAGSWGDVTKGMGKGHYFIARNPKINTAISLCREVVIGFDKIALTDMPVKCLVCALLAERREKEALGQDKKQHSKHVTVVYRTKHKQLSLF